MISNFQRVPLSRAAHALRGHLPYSPSILSLQSKNKFIKRTVNFFHCGITFLRKDLLVEKPEEIVKIGEIPLRPKPKKPTRVKKTKTAIDKASDVSEPVIPRTKKSPNKKAKKILDTATETIKEYNETTKAVIMDSVSNIRPQLLPEVKTVKLRPYQKECIEATLEAHRQGIFRQVVSLPVGTGKTIVMAHLIPLIPSPTPEATKTLVIAHRQELLFQAVEKITKHCPNLRVDLERGTHSCDIQNTDVIVASVQSLSVKSSIRLKKFDPKLFKCLIIDEAHHASATSYKTVLNHFGLYKSPTFNPVEFLRGSQLESSTKTENSDLPDNTSTPEPKKFNKGIFLWGCSATLRRHDGVGLTTAFDHISYHKDFFDMVKEKWLCDIQVTSIKTKVDLSGIGSYLGDFMISRLAPVIDTPPRNELIVHSFNRLAAGRKSTLVFACDVNHVENLRSTFLRFGIACEAITSKTPMDLRTFHLDQFRQNKIKVLINCSILTEGLDIPSVDCIIMARPTRSRPLYQQMLGRGMRQFEGKENCLVLDFVDILRDKTLCTVPTLLGLDYDTEIIGESLANAVKKIPDESRVVRKPPSSPTIKDIQLKHYGTIHDLGDNNKASWYIGFNSKYGWIWVDEGIYALPLSVGSVRLEKKDETTYIAKFRRKIPSPKGGFTSAQPLPIKADSLAMLVRATETFIEKIYPDAVRLARRNGLWRSKAASEGQIKMLARHFKPPGSDLDDPVEENSHLKGLTRGEATDLINLVKEGGLRAYRRDFEQASRQFKFEEKQLKKKITVGPITI